MSSTTINKTYRETHHNHYTLYGDCPVNDPAIFFEYWRIVYDNFKCTKDELIGLINSHVPKSKAKIRIDFNGKDMEITEIEFFAPNKYIFPKFYVKFNI